MASTKVTTGKVRLSYVHLFERQKNDEDDGEGKFSTVILIPKSDKETLNKIDAAIKQAAEDGKHKKFDGRVPANLVTTLHDGDDEDVLEKNPEYAGHMFMAISSSRRVGVVDKDVNPIMDSTEVYSGCYARVVMNAFAFNYKGKKGVSFGLNHVQKIADGESLAGLTRAEDEFDAYEDEESDSLI